MHWVLLLVGTAIVVECFVRLPVGTQANAMLGTVRTVINTIKSPRISDHWKERVLPAYAGRLFRTSLYLFALVCLAIAPIIALGIAADAFGLEFMAFLATWNAILGSTVFAALYFTVRNRLK